MSSVPKCSDFLTPGIWGAGGGGGILGARLVVPPKGGGVQGTEEGGIRQDIKRGSEGKEPSGTGPVLGVSEPGSGAPQWAFASLPVSCLAPPPYCHLQVRA